MIRKRTLLNTTYALLGAIVAPSVALAEGITAFLTLIGLQFVVAYASVRSRRASVAWLPRLRPAPHCGHPPGWPPAPRMLTRDRRCMILHNMYRVRDDRMLMLGSEFPQGYVSGLGTEFP